MKTKHFFNSAACIALSIFAVGCSNEDTAVGTTEGQFTTFVGRMNSAPMTRVQINENGSVSASTLTELTRTSMERTDVGQGCTFSWEQGDYIYVSDDSKTWKKSTDSVNQKTDKFVFHLNGTFSENGTYTALYKGNNANADDKVTIATAQTQSAFNNTEHFKNSGDCAAATATKATSGYEFNLEHKASYLCFLPYAEEPTERMNYKIKSVKVTSNNEIAGSYNLLNSSLEGGTKEITLTVDNDGQGLALANLDVATKHIDNSLYMVVAPGTHQLTIICTVYDAIADKETIIIKKYQQQKLQANTIYDIPLDIDFTKVKVSLYGNMDNTTTQAIAVWGDYIVAGLQNSIYKVLRKSDLSTLKTGTMPANNTTAVHNNMVCFGVEYPSGNTTFPAFYATHWDGNRGVVVYNVKSDYSIEQIQVIEPSTELKSNPTFGLGYTDYLIDRDNGFMYSIGYKENTWENKTSNTTCICKFNIPKLSAGSRVELQSSDILDSFEVETAGARQDGCIHQGILYFDNGFDNPRILPTIRVVDLSRKKLIKKIDLTSMRSGKTLEPEGLCVDEDHILFTWAFGSAMQAYYGILR